MLHALAPVRIQAPALMPVSLAEAKRHLCVEHADDDALITGLIGSVVDHLDGWTGVLGRCLLTQTWETSFSAFPACGPLRLPLAPLAPSPEVVVEYLDAVGASQTLSAALYYVLTDRLGPCISLAPNAAIPAISIRPAAVTVTATFGYGDEPSDVPAAIRAAILMQVGDLYANRETTISNRLVLNPSVDRLLSPYCRVN